MIPCDGQAIKSGFILDEEHSSVNRFRQGAIRINRAFAELNPLLARIHLMSFNAKLASHKLGEEGQSFAVIVTEVRVMAMELKALIREAEAVLWNIVNEVAMWVKTDEHLRLFRKAASLMAPASDDGDGEKTRGTNSTGQKLLGKIAHYQAEIDANLVKLAKHSTNLHGIIEKIDLVASRKSDFLAITSMIESARVTCADNSLGAVAENIRVLAVDIATAEEKASGQAVELLYMANAMTAGLKSR